MDRRLNSKDLGTYLNTEAYTMKRHPGDFTEEDLALRRKELSRKLKNGANGRSSFGFQLSSNKTIQGAYLKAEAPLAQRTLAAVSSIFTVTIHV